MTPAGDPPRIPEVAAILAAGYLRLLLAQAAPSGPTPQKGAPCGTQESAPSGNTPVDVLPRESPNCGDGRLHQERADRRPDSPVGRDPGPYDGSAPGRIPAALGPRNRLVEQGMAAAEGVVADPGGRASDVRRRRTSDAGGRGARRATKPTAGRADPGIGCSRSPRSAPPEAGNGPGPRVPRPAAHGDRTRAGV